MNNLKTLTLAICFTFVASVASAGVQMGISAHAIMFESTGSETLRQSGNVTNKSVDEDVVVPSIFIEALNSDGIGIGIDYVPVAELGSQSSTNKVDAETNGENKASAELASHVTLYVLKETSNGLFVKAGVAFADVDTTENLSTGDSYKDTDTKGLMIGFGKHFDLNNMFVRGSVSYTDYEEVSITSVIAAVCILAARLYVAREVSSSNRGANLTHLTQAKH